MLALDSTSVNELNKYGCVCSGIKMGGKQRGRPVDELDRACFVWRKCHQCNGPKCGGYKLNQFQQCSKNMSRVGTF